MSIALINLPSPALGEPWSNFPLGLGYMAAVCERAGYPTRVLDYCEGFEPGTPLPAAEVYGMSVVTPQGEEAKRMAAELKRQHPHSLVVAGGPHVQVDKGDDLLSTGDVDAVVSDEAETSFLRLLRDYEGTGRVQDHYYDDPLSDLDQIPFPARHLFPSFKSDALRTHALLKGDYVSGGQTTIIASRGCPYKCAFCAPHPFKVRFRTPQNVVDEIRDVIERFGIRQFKWQDDTFTIKKKWVLELCALIQSELPPIYHRAHTRVNVMDDELAQALWDAGVRILCFGIESFDQRLLNLNAKSISVEQIESALRIVKKHGFKTVGFLIFGMPGETPESVENTKRAILKNKPYLDYLNLATMVPLLGTPVREAPERFGAEILELDQSKYWIVDHEVTDDILVRTKGVPLDIMKEMKTGMYQFMRDEGFSRPEWKHLESAS